MGIFLNKDVLIIIPTYNEIDNIEHIIKEIFNINESYNILIVDDNSKDGTGEIVEHLKKNFYQNKLFCIHRKGKLGLGTAYIEGFKFGLKNKYEYIFEMDADFSHKPEDIPRLLAATKEADLVIGSRFYKWKLSVVNWPLKRLILSMLGYRYVKLVLGTTGLYDNTSGFKCFSRAVLEAFDLNKIKSTGYCFQIELNFRALKKGFRIKEVPIIFEDRRYGNSKMARNIIQEALIMPVKLKIESILKGKEF